MSGAMAGDALDDLLDYNANEDDVFQDVDTNMDVPLRSKEPPRLGKNRNTSELGIDEEIQITKKRRPVVKLDQHRLLSQAGIPKIRQLAKERLRFKGNGHEYSDAARLLNVYQLWLDALYPRAKFADAVEIIEKLGHTKELQKLRREWINEGKPQDKEATGSRHIEELTTMERTSSKTHDNTYMSTNTDRRATTPVVNNYDDDDDDLYSASPRHPHQPIESARTNLPRVDDLNDSLFVSDNEADSQPSDDELEALLNKDIHDKYRSKSGKETLPISEGRPARPELEFEDDIEAMAGMDYMQ